MKKEFVIMQNTYSFFRKSQLLISTAVGKIVSIPCLIDIVGLTYYKYLLVYIIGLIILERNPNMTRISKRMRFCVEDSLYRMLNFMTLPLRALSTFLIAYISKTRKTPGYLIIDDTVISKKIGYTDYAWSSSDNRVVLLWDNGNRKIPVSFLLWRTRSKTKHYKTKLDLARQLVCYNIKFCISCDYLVFDSWYCSKKFLSILKNLGIPCMSRLTRNRNVIFKGQKMKVTDLYSTHRRGTMLWDIPTRNISGVNIPFQAGRFFFLCLLSSFQAVSGERRFLLPRVYSFPWVYFFLRVISCPE
ncbi:MAG: transposase [Candidatus Eremiobacteraeota bacterium]|nr:transposase [Candidatus Eremiobacteraeota bacterium]